LGNKHQILAFVLEKTLISLRPYGTLLAAKKVFEILLEFTEKFELLD
jgi:hypothetical protein